VNSPGATRLAAALGVSIFVVWAALGLPGRFPDPEELNALVGARALLDGQPLPPWLGTLTRYEGGSWLIAAPLSLLLALGLEGVAATGTLALISAALGVALASVWAGRVAGAPAALLTGPLLAFGCRPLATFATVGTGGTTDFLFALPLFALVGERWKAGDRSHAGVAALGLLAGAAAAASFAHLATAAVLGLLVLHAARPSTRVRTAASFAAAAAVFPLGWLLAVGGGELRPPTLRDGRGGGDLLSALFPPRLGSWLADLPAAIGGRTADPPAFDRFAATTLAVLLVIACLDAARQPGPRRRAATAAGLLALAATAGPGLTNVPADLVRYSLPAIATALVLAATRPPLGVAVLAVGLALGPPPVPLIAPGSPDDGAMALGLLYAEVREPATHQHERARAVLARLPTQHHSALVFGHGVRSGTRLQHLMTAPPETWAGWRFGGAASWLAGPSPAHRDAWLQGLGAGLAQGGVTPLERLFLGLATPADRADLNVGLGLPGDAPTASLAAARLDVLRPRLELAP